MLKPIVAAALIALAPLSATGYASAAPLEDQPGWSCTSDGNRICGANNAQGAPAGRYDEGGVLVETWDQMLARCGRSDICLGA